MPRHLIALITFLALILAPMPLLAEDGDDDDDTPPWLGDDDDDDDDDEGEGEGEADTDDSSGESGTETESSKKKSTKTARAKATTGSEAPKGGGPLGLGFTVGSINGFSMKVWPHRKHGMVLHLGSPAILNSMALQLSYRVHIVEVAVPDSGVTIGVNLGPAFRARFAWFTNGLFLEMAGGLALGAGVTVEGVPAEIFFEVAPSFGGGVSPANVGVGFSVDGMVGARFYVGK